MLLKSTLCLCVDNTLRNIYQSEILYNINFSWDFKGTPQSPY